MYSFRKASCSSMSRSVPRPARTASPMRLQSHSLGAGAEQGGGAWWESEGKAPAAPAQGRRGAKGGRRQARQQPSSSNSSPTAATAAQQQPSSDNSSPASTTAAQQQPSSSAASTTAAHAHLISSTGLPSGVIASSCVCRASGGGGWATGPAAAGERRRRARSAAAHALCAAAAGAGQVGSSHPEVLGDKLPPGAGRPRQHAVHSEALAPLVRRARLVAAGLQRRLGLDEPGGVWGREKG